MRFQSACLSAVVILVLAALPALVVTAQSFQEPHFERTWARTDQPVAQGAVDRTWMWGPEPFTETVIEPYADAPGGERLVQYTDKSRMEDNAWRAEPPWDVTNGLIALELITGNMQMGDDQFEQYDAAEIQVAGDPDPNSPTYATFEQVLDQDPLAEGSTITQTIDRDGTIGDNAALAEHNVLAQHYVPETDHMVASRFWEFMNSAGLVYEDGQTFEDDLFENPFFATGLPVTEAFWMTVPVAGEPREVLAQCFERRCLTFNPDNQPGWQVEAGNIGQHYYEWRYEQVGLEPPRPANGDPPPPPDDCEPGEGPDHSGQQLPLTDFSGQDLACANFVDAGLAETNFSGANLFRALFDGEGTEVGNVNFSNANLTEALFRGTLVSMSNFSGATVTDASFSGAELGSPVFTGANLTRVDFSGAELTDASFTGGANLSNANFTNAQMTSPVFSDADLTGANFSGAIVALASFDNTICPDGINSDDQGGTCPEVGGGF